MTKDKIQGLLDGGYNLNQIAAIHMVSRAELEKTLAEKPVEKKTKKSNKVNTQPMFTDEPGL